MYYINRACVETGEFIYHHFAFRFSDWEDKLNQTTRDKISDFAACAFVTLAGVVSFFTFPQITLAGFVIGHCFRKQIRLGVAGLWQTFLKVDAVSKAILCVFAFTTWPYLFLAVPALVGCYVGWQSLDRSKEDNSFFYPPDLMNL